MMAYGIRCMGFANGSIGAPIGQWLESYEPEAFNGRGDCAWTADPKRAMRFVRSLDAFATWRQIPINRAVREDGKLNRPLTAFTVSVEPLPQ